MMIQNYDAHRFLSTAKLFKSVIYIDWTTKVRPLNLSTICKQISGLVVVFQQPEIVLLYTFKVFEVLLLEPSSFN